MNFATASNTRWGGTVGVGLEYGFTPNWSFGVEYMHAWLGNNDYAWTNANCAAMEQPPRQSGHRSGHPPAQLSLRWPGGRKVLI